MNNLSTKLSKLICLITITGFLFAYDVTAQQCTSSVGSGLCPGNPPPRIDLASMCFDNPLTSSVLEFSWNYTSSNPDGASCGYLDTDGDGNANYAACARSDGTQESLFLCNDTQTNTCPGFTLVPASSFDCAQSSGLVSCSISTTDFTSSYTTLVNVCSHTSNDGVDPNGTCKDCVVQGATIVINKTAYDYNNNLIPSGSPFEFSFNVSGSSTGSASVLGSGTTQLSFASGNL